MTREEALAVAKPILFNTEMVIAIQNATKTVTRRVIKPRYRKNEREFFTATIAGTLFLCYSDEEDKETRRVKAPYQVGDLLYVRETWKRFCGMLYGWENGTYIPLDDFEGYQYKADGQCICTKGFNPLCGGFEDQKSDIHFDDNWRPSIHMPKEAARIFLRVTDVSAERLQNSFFGSERAIFALLREGVNIGEQCQDCILAYGNPCCVDDESECRALDEVRSDYSDLWDSTVKKSDIDQYGWAANPPVLAVTFERVEVSE